MGRGRRDSRRPLGEGEGEGEQEGEGARERGCGEASLTSTSHGNWVPSSMVTWHMTILIFLESRRGDRMLVSALSVGSSSLLVSSPPSSSSSTPFSALVSSASFSWESSPFSSLAGWYREELRKNNKTHKRIRSDNHHPIHTRIHTLRQNLHNQIPNPDFK